MNSTAPMIVEQAYWDSSYKRYAFSRVPETDATRQIIRKLVPPAAHGQSAFEIGCFPGRYLVELGALGYIVSGCDRTERVEIDLKQWLESQACTVGSLSRGDFRSVATGKFDVVGSFGFVEHFEEFRSVVEFQMNLVKPGGLAIVQFPNFHGLVQRTLRALLDRDNLANHVITAMDLNNYLPWIGDFGEIVYAGHYGRFDFWTDDYRGRNGRVRRKLIAMLDQSRPLWSHVPDSRHWSPFAAIAVRTGVHSPSQKNR